MNLKQLRKILAACLSVIMITAGFAAIANEAQISTENEFVEMTSMEFDALNTMGMLGEDFAALSANEPVTRAQFVGSLYSIAGYEKLSYGIEEIPFIDVSLDMPYKDEICGLYEMGIIKGTSENTFAPNAPISYSQAVKLIISVCGYDEFTKAKYGSDMQAYVAMAMFLKLSTGISISDVNAPLEAEKAVKLLYNAARTKVMEPSVFTTNDVVYYDSENGEELIERLNKIYYTEGVITSNGIVSTTSSEINEEYATISDEKYLINGLDLSKFIGCRVKFFYKKDTAPLRLMWVGDDERNSILELESDELVVGSPSYTMQNIVYKRNNKTYSAKVSPRATVIYNNALYNDATITHLKPQMGNIKLIDNDNNNEYETVIIEEYRNVFLTSNITPLAYLGDKYGPAIDLSDYDHVKIYKDNKEVNAEDITLGSIVSVVADERHKRRISLYVNEEYVQGVFEAIGDKDGKEVYQIDGKEYEIAPSFVNRAANYIKVNPVLGGKYKFYFDKYGKIAEIEEINGSYLDYALIVNAIPNPERYAEPNSAAVKLVLKNGDVTWSYTRKRLTIDGVGNKTGADLLAMPLYDDGGEFIEQVVRVAFDSDGNLKEIDFATDNTTHPYGYDASQFTLDYSGTGSVVSRNGQLRFEKYILDSSVKVFVKYTDLDDGTEPYAVINGNSLGQGSKTMKIYDINADQSITFAYTTISSRSTLASEFLVSDVFYKKIDDETAKCIAGYYGGTYMEYAELTPGKIPAGIKRGDVVDISLYKQRVTGVTKFISFADGPNPVADGTFLSNDFRIFSYVYTASNAMLTMLAPDGFATDYGKVLPMSLEKIYAIPIMVYDVKNDEMYKGTPGDLFSSTYPEKDGTLPIDENTVMALIESSNQKITDIILVKY